MARSVVVRIGRSWIGALAASAALGAAGAQALTINIVAGAGLAANQAALDAFNRAADSWEGIFTDPISVQIDANLAALGPNILGSTSSVTLVAGYNLIRGQMVADAADELDDAVVAALPTAAQFSAFVPAGFSLSANMAGTKANLKAMGFGGLDGLFGASDGDITFSSTFAFDFDNSDGVGAGLIDFETVAAHEIGHLLGFVSSVDQIDFLVDNGQTAAISLQPLDLFRFNDANDPTTLAQFTANPRDLRPNATAVFDDLINEFLMSTGAFNGDGNQASHWKADDITGSLIGIMDPTLGFQQIYPISMADIRALDVIGWDFELAAAVPEPAAAVLLGLGLAGAARARRRRA